MSLLRSALVTRELGLEGRDEGGGTMIDGGLFAKGCEDD